GDPPDLHPCPTRRSSALAHAIAEEALARNLDIAVVGVPKTIDNDIPLIGTSFGFQTAYAKAAESIKGARVEVEAAIGGVGVVKRSEEHTSELQSRENLVC